MLDPYVNGGIWSLVYMAYVGDLGLGFEKMNQPKSEVLRQVGVELSRVQAVAQRYLQSNAKKPKTKRTMSEDEVRRVTEVYLAWLGLQTLVNTSSTGVLTTAEVNQATQGLKTITGVADELHRIHSIFQEPQDKGGRPTTLTISFSE